MNGRTRIHQPRVLGSKHSSKPAKPTTAPASESGIASKESSKTAPPTASSGHGHSESLNLEHILEVLGEAAEGHDRVTVRTMCKAIGARSFGPLLLLVGLIALSPLIAIPTIPTIVAMTVLLIVGQLLFRRKHFWLPDWLLRRSISSQRFKKALKFLHKPARFIDRFLRPRLTKLTRGAGAYGVAIACVIVACMMPIMEIVPFAAHSAGAALTAFALALMAQDGLLALIALGFTLGAAALVVNTLIL